MLVIFYTDAIEINWKSIPWNGKSSCVLSEKDHQVIKMATMATMVASPAPICSNTKYKIFLTPLQTSKSLAARCNGQNWGRRYKTSWKTAKRQLNSHFLPRPLKKRSGPGHEERALGAKSYRANGPLPLPSWLVLSTIWNVLTGKQKLKIDCNFQFLIFRLPPNTEKLSHATDCNIVRKGNCRSVSIFLFIVDRIK